MLNLFIKKGKSAGFLNWAKIWVLTAVTRFVFLIGGRGTGKTFGLIELLLGLNPDLKLDPDEVLPMVFMRRRDCELKAVFGEGAKDNPFYDIAEAHKDENINFYYEPAKGGANKRPGILYWGKYEEVEDKNGETFLQLVPDKERPPVAYCTALSNFAGIRGYGGLKCCKTFVYDEFIKELITPNMRGEFEALMNAYETVNRNRDLNKCDANGNEIPGTAEPAVRFFALANANDITNPIFVGLKIVKHVQKMVKEHIPFKQFVNKELTVIQIGAESPISQKKKHTALYKLTEGTEFYKMSVENKFNEDDCDVIKPQDLKNYDPICASAFYGFTVYKRRGKEKHDGKNIQMYYVSDHLTERNVRRFGKGKAEKERFLRSYSYLWYAYIENRVIFEDYLVLEFFHRMFDMSEE